MRLILINGRKAKPEGVAPLKNEQLSQVINSYEELFERVGLEDAQTDRKKLLILRAKAIALKQKQSIQ